MMYPLFSPSGFSLCALRAQVLLVALGFMACLPLAQADMIIETTRVIYPESKREVSFKVSNVSKERPAFVQMWLDDGNAAAAPEDAITPFNLTPPVAKLKADSNQVVRLVFTGEPLPADRESVFWFNMLELPQKSSAENKLSFAVRTRIKVFYRPKTLKGEPTEYMAGVSWKVVKKDGKWVAEGTNPSPFNMSFFSMAFGRDGKFDLNAEGGMVPPKGNLSVVVGEVSKITKPYNTIRVDYISDYGGVVSKEAPVQFGN
jgi:P pilus assembly chaperone PapD